MKIVKSPLYFHEKRSDFDEIWYTNAALKVRDSHVTKYKNF